MINSLFMFWGNNSVVVILGNEFKKNKKHSIWVPFSLYVMSVSMFSLLFYGLFHFTMIYQEIKKKVCWHKSIVTYQYLEQTNIESLPYCCKIDDASPLSLKC